MDRFIQLFLLFERNFSVGPGDIAPFSILAGGTHVYVTIISEGAVLMLLFYVSHVLEDFFSRSRIPPVI